jgi:hypothetical protein
MPSPLLRLYRRARYGKPIVVVSGLPRSGTSMMMQMLEAGGLEILTDRIRSADESNPQGYYELERVKDLDKGGDPSWLEDARGKTVKIIAFLLRYLPENLNYRIIFMQRDLEEIVASQAKMLVQRQEASETDDDRIIELFKQHLSRTRNLIMSHACFDVLEVRYSDVIRNPVEQAECVSRFLGGVPDVQSMAAVVDPQLYRNRRHLGRR